MATQQITACGKILKEREDSYNRVEMVYWGADADPKLTIVVEDKQDESMYFLAPNDDDVSHAFNHPAHPDYERFVPPIGFKEMYA